MSLPDPTSTGTSTGTGAPTGPAPLRVGYVLTMFPRFSETFVLSELLALEGLAHEGSADPSGRAAVEVSVFSMRQPDDGRFHAAVADVRAPVTYLTRTPKASTLWAALQRTHHRLPGLAAHLDEVLALPVDEGVAALEVAAAAVEQGLDHLHAHFANSPATVARVAARIAGITCSFTAHAKDIFHTGLDADALHANLAGADAVVTVSDFNTDFLRRLQPAAADRVVRLYNGLDLDRFARSHAPRSPRTIATVGRLVPKKGFDVLLAAVAALRSASYDVRLQVVGTGAEGDRLHALARDLGVADAVDFLGALPQDRMKEVVASAAVFAAPCVVAEDGNRDGLPTVLLEALALGTPCVATPVTGIPEAVVDGVTGRIVPSSDPAALADALRAVLDGPATAASYADAGRTLVEERFDVRRNAAVLAEVFRSVARPVTDPRTTAPGATAPSTTARDLAGVGA